MAVREEVKSSDWMWCPIVVFKRVNQMGRGKEGALNASHFASSASFK